jgi:hypothetical protein
MTPSRNFFAGSGRLLAFVAGVAACLFVQWFADTKRPAVDANLAMRPVVLGNIAEKDKWIEGCDVFCGQLQAVRTRSYYKVLVVGRKASAHIAATNPSPLEPGPYGGTEFYLSRSSSREDRKPVFIDPRAVSDNSDTPVVCVLDFINGDFDLADGESYILDSRLR